MCNFCYDSLLNPCSAAVNGSKQLLFILFLMSVITTIIVDLCVTQIHNKNNKDKDQAGEK